MRGAGADQVFIDTLGGHYTITLGAGSDTLLFLTTGGSFHAGEANFVTDFQTGSGGDVLNFFAYLASALLNQTDANPLL